MQNNFLIWIPINDPIHVHTYILGENNFILFYIWIFSSALSKIHTWVKRVTGFARCDRTFLKLKVLVIPVIIMRNIKQGECVFFFYYLFIY